LSFRATIFISWFCVFIFFCFASNYFIFFVQHTQWKPNTVAQWNIPYAPVFRPTLAEFKSPLEYIAKIRPTAEKYPSKIFKTLANKLMRSQKKKRGGKNNFDLCMYGICVIIPPYPAVSWDQNIGDPKTLTFRTKVQHIHQLKTRYAKIFFCCDRFWQND